MDGRVRRAVLAAGLLFSLAAGAATAASPDGKLLATGGATPFEGAAGRDLTPRALIGGYGTREQIGGTVFATMLDIERRHAKRRAAAI